LLASGVQMTLLRRPVAEFIALGTFLLLSVSQVLAQSSMTPILESDVMIDIVGGTDFRTEGPRQRSNLSGTRSQVMQIFHPYSANSGFLVVQYAPLGNFGGPTVESSFTARGHQRALEAQYKDAKPVITRSGSVPTPGGRAFVSWFTLEDQACVMASKGFRSGKQDVQDTDMALSHIVDAWICGDPFELEMLANYVPASKLATREDNNRAFADRRARSIPPLPNTSRFPDIPYFERVVRGWPPVDTDFGEAVEMSALPFAFPGTSGFREKAVRRKIQGQVESYRLIWTANEFVSNSHTMLLHRGATGTLPPGFAGERLSSDFHIAGLRRTLGRVPLTNLVVEQIEAPAAHGTLIRYTAQSATCVFAAIAFGAAGQEDRLLEASFCGPDAERQRFAALAQER